ncbi:MAG: endonuclease/exonuclease/phosphatase family protein, partial [Verrucomicrobiales bacterium]|nr:endonuclease/exonuclease/phosphatase family protein [Verrucomicrobiales bacterium]
MHGFRRTWILGWVTAMVLATGTTAMAAGADGPGSVILATYNLENYVLAPTATRQAKTEASKARVAAVLAGLNADLVALQEVGGAEALEDLRGRLAAAGRAYEHREWVRGFDTNIQVALLSRFPIVERRPHTRDAYLLAGKRFFVSRGILEAEVAVNPTYRLTVFVAHLKSRRTSSEADEREMRREEARILREKIDERLKAEPRANVVVMGDLNDTKDSRPVRLLIGRGKNPLFDTRPS